jgi:hypothetical protein
MLIQALDTIQVQTLQVSTFYNRGEISVVKNRVNSLPNSGLVPKLHCLAARFRYYLANRNLKAVVTWLELVPEKQLDSINVHIKRHRVHILIATNHYKLCLIKVVDH